MLRKIMAVKYRAGSWQMVAITIMHLTERCMGHHPGQLGLTGKTGEGKVCLPEPHLQEECQLLQGERRFLGCVCRGGG